MTESLYTQNITNNITITRKDVENYIKFNTIKNIISSVPNMDFYSFKQNNISNIPNIYPATIKIYKNNNNNDINEFVKLHFFPFVTDKIDIVEYKNNNRLYSFEIYYPYVILNITPEFFNLYRGISSGIIPKTFNISQNDKELLNHPLSTLFERLYKIFNKNKEISNMMYNNIQMKYNTNVLGKSTIKQSIIEDMKIQIVDIIKLLTPFIEKVSPFLPKIKDNDDGDSNNNRKYYYLIGDIIEVYNINELNMKIYQTYKIPFFSNFVIMRHDIKSNVIDKEMIISCICFNIISKMCLIGDSITIQLNRNHHNKFNNTDNVLEYDNGILLSHLGIYSSIYRIFNIWAKRELYSTIKL